jgi:anti-sigma regulatory factor (Ser/Thr protein kinase)
MPTHTIRQLVDVYVPRRTVEELGTRLGFAKSERQELAIVVSELCSNIVKYGIRGSIEIERVEDPVHGVGLSIVARDVGPAFRDLGMALQDGCDDQGPIDPAKMLKRGGLGIGLGAVVRLMDTLDVVQHKAGKEIRAIRYLRRPRGAAGGVAF